MWQLTSDDLLALGALALMVFLFGMSILFGRFLSMTFVHSYSFVFRWANVSMAFVGSCLAAFLAFECVEWAIVVELVLIISAWGLLVGFERRFVFKDFFSRTFWFPEKNENTQQ